MTSTLQTIASTTSKLRVLLQETRKDLERIQTLQNTLSESLESFFEPGPSANPGNIVIAEEPPAFELARDPKLWKETLSLVPSGRVLAVAAQAEDVLSTGAGALRACAWIADGKAYVKWIATGTTALCASGDGKSAVLAASSLLGKAIGIGYTDELVATLIQTLVVEKALPELFYKIVTALSAWEQRQILASLLKFLDRSVGAWNRPGVEDAATKSVSADAALLHEMLQHTPKLQDDLLEQLLTRPNNILIVRASLLAFDLEHLRAALERSWEYFGDKLHIKHKPILQQETNAQILLLAAGNIHRTDPMAVFVLARSSNHGNAISDRLSSSSPRVRWIGMVVGTAISALVDKEGTRMDFGVEEMQTDAAVWFRKLVKIEDHLGTVNDFIKIANHSEPSIKPKVTKIAKEKVHPPPMAKKAGIIEVVDDDNDLLPYLKPDSDPEDSEEDATLVNRKKPKAPVYIRDLISGINDGENYDRHLLALSTAPSLIRRKADFGSELKDRAEELASSLVSLHDNFDIANWLELRQQALIALIVAQPRIMGSWFAKMLFLGDYSVSQRAAMLTSIGLGCRELAGLGQENTRLIKHQQEINKTFPTKQLPDRLHKVYADDSVTMDCIARQLEQTMLRPVSTKQRLRTKLLKNNLASIVADSFFFPLTGTWQSFSQTTSSNRSPLSNPTVLALLVKTLIIIYTAAGTSYMALPQMTSELWMVLLSLRTRGLQHPPLLEAVLFGFLSMLDINEKRGMAEHNGSVLIETREWVAMVWDRLEEEGQRGSSGSTGIEMFEDQKTSDTGSKDVERCRYLAAGVLVKIKEIVDEYQRLLVGNLPSI